MKRSIAVLLCISLFCSGLPALAHGQDKHNEELEKVLFVSKSVPQGKEKTFKAIADAASLCIDQFTTSRSDKREEFEKLTGSVHLSMSFEDIELNSKKAGESITANTHRKYTHQGWNYDNYPLKELWEIRKKLLLETSQQMLFDNDIPSIPFIANIIRFFTRPSKQCDAFCALVYYVHILGDHSVADKPDENLAGLEPLVRYENSPSPGIIPELQKYLPELFPEQSSSWTFMALMQELDLLNWKAEKVCYSQGGIDTEEECKLNQANAKELLDILGAYIPTLLKNEDFFKKAFKS